MKLSFRDADGRIRINVGLLLLIVAAAVAWSSRDDYEDVVDIAVGTDRQLDAEHAGPATATP